MARARNIKPGLFKNELLAEREPAVRLLFIGLWTLADREGRVEDRPKRIKLELFPYDDCEIDSMLSFLEQDGFIERYQVAGKSVILIKNFLKHQNPHGTEKDSELPDKDGSFTIHERTANGCVTGTKRKNNVNSTLEECESTVKAPLVNALNPESLILIPDLLNPEVLTQGKPAKSPEFTFDKFVEQRKELGLSAIIESDPVWEVIDSLGMPDDFAELQWRYLESQYSAKKGGKAKRYKQWPLVLKKSLAELWGQLFFKSEHGWVLTSKGKNLKELAA